MLDAFRASTRHKRLFNSARVLVHEAAEMLTTTPEEVTPDDLVALAFGRYRIRIDAEEAADYLRAALVAEGHSIAHLADETIRYTADIIVTTDDGSIALIERDWAPYEGRWALPGGHVDPGETALQAAVRELAEETGLHVPAGDLREIGTFDRPDRDPRGRYVTVAYSTQVPADTALAAGTDARTARWWPLSQLPELAFDHADIIAAALKGATA